MRSSASNRNISFLPELIDVALLGWVIWEGTERGTFAGTREAAGCFQRHCNSASRLMPGNWTNVSWKRRQTERCR